MPDQLLKAIGPEKLTDYFVFLDEVRESGQVDMYVPAILANEAGVSIFEARAVVDAWRNTFSETLPAEDRVDALLDA